MRTLRSVFSVALTGALAVLTACHDEMRPPTAEGVAGSRSRFGIATGSRHDRPGEAAFLALAKEEPSTAGYYLDASGALVVQVADSLRSASAASAAARLVRLGVIPLTRRYAGARIIGHSVQYRFQQLSDWRDLVSDSLLSGRRGVFSVDLDEVRNRVTIGVRTGDALVRAAALRGARELGIPAAAVAFEEADGVTLTAPTPPALREMRRFINGTSLTDTTDTIGGGFRYREQNAGNCSIGVVADRSGTRGFVSASHCTTTQWGVDAGNAFQPESTSGYYLHYIGHETVDPAGVSCSVFQTCNYKRSSEATFFALDGSFPGKRGAIARPSQRASGSAGNLSLASPHRWINVWAALSSVTVGEVLDKIGAVAGWTYGSVATTCEDRDFDRNGNTYRVFCSNRVNAFTGQGDSGGPVFGWDGEDGAIFYGIVWAIPCTNCSSSSQMLFSSYGSVESDLGSLNVVSEITVGTPSVGGSINGGGNPVLTWSAVSTTNTSATTTYKVFRSVWDASTYTWTSQDVLIGTTTATSFTDTGNPVSVNAFDGTSQPASCTYTFIAYSVRAYNSGIPAPSPWVYFEGAANGPTPWQFTCP